VARREGATGYQISVMTPEDEPLFVSPRLPRNSWVIPHERALPPVETDGLPLEGDGFLPERTETSEAAAFASSSRACVRGPCSAPPTPRLNSAHPRNNDRSNR